MRFTQRRLVLVCLCAALVAACNNDNFTNKGTIQAGNRFQLIVDQQVPARLLLDSVSGDLWQLQPDPGGSSHWGRLARGPADARSLTPQEALGLKSKGTPTS